MRIAFVQSYPYDAAAGGDGAYIQALGQYLNQQGHEIHGFVTDTTRGRTSPIYKSVYLVDKYRSWCVHNTVQVGRKMFVDYRFHRIAIKFLEKLIGQRQATADIDKWVPREALWTLKQLEKLRPDVVILFFESVHFAQFLSPLNSNIFSMPGPLPGRELGRTLTSPFLWPDQLEISAAQSRLAAALAKAGCAGLNSHDDLLYASERLGVKRGLVVGMGFPSQTTFPESDEPIILFVGNATTPNCVGIRWFLENVWPAIRLACPDAKLRIVGRVAFSEEAASGGEMVERVGPVANLALEYKRAQIVIAPLITGTAGVKIKVAEAMSYGRPLVTTSIGVDGGDPHQLDPAAIIADDPGDFAHGVIALLRDSNLRRGKSSGAPKVFESCFSYDASYGRVLEWINHCAAAL